MKKSFYRLAKIHHPDRVPESERLIANEKFNIICQAYTVLSNPETKRVYDTDKNIKISKATIVCDWTKYIKTVDRTVFEDKKMSYQGSLSEKEDILREIISGNGSMTHLYNVIPFMRYEDEVRIIDIIRSAIQAGEIQKIAIKKIPKRK